MWYPPPRYHPAQYMYTEHPYEWAPMPPPMPAPMPAPMPPRRAYEERRATYADEPRADVEESAEAAVAKAFATLVDAMTVQMGRSLARTPVHDRIVPFAALSSSADTAAVRGSAPSPMSFKVKVPLSVEEALTDQIAFLEWMITQSATNIHHRQHAAFHAALRMARAAARFTRLMYRQAGGVGSAYQDPELRPVPDRAAAFHAYEHITRFVNAEKNASPSDRGYKTALDAINRDVTDKLAAVAKFWTQ